MMTPPPTPPLGQGGQPQPPRVCRHHKRAEYVMGHRWIDNHLSIHQGACNYPCLLNYPTHRCPRAEIGSVRAMVTRKGELMWVLMFPSYILIPTFESICFAMVQ